MACRHHSDLGHPDLNGSCGRQATPTAGAAAAAPAPATAFLRGLGASSSLAGEDLNNAAGEATAALGNGDILQQRYTPFGNGTLQPCYTPYRSRHTNDLATTNKQWLLPDPVHDNGGGDGFESVMANGGGSSSSVSSISNSVGSISSISSSIAASPSGTCGGNTTYTAAASNTSTESRGYDSGHNKDGNMGTASAAASVSHIGSGSGQILKGNDGKLNGCSNNYHGNRSSCNSHGSGSITNEIVNGNNHTTVVRCDPRVVSINGTGNQRQYDTGSDAGCCPVPSNTNDGRNAHRPRRNHDATSDSVLFGSETRGNGDSLSSNETMRSAAVLPSTLMFYLSVLLGIFIFSILVRIASYRSHYEVIMSYQILLAMVDVCR
ncbi:hypothetical protein Vretifemale_6982 [Volvox reticuliferus]|nr:hypothetical protein Vretifemale_6982 [Volvox reticuliferus]